MYSFGKRPARALESFGVSGLLGEECHVFYQSMFSTRHLGRVSDLISARLKKAGPDELRMRALLLFTVYEAYRSRVAGSPAQPMTVECGIDKEKVAIGVSFKAPASLNLDGLAERIEEGEPSGSFEALLFDIKAHADRVVLRIQPETGRAEVVALMGIRGKMDAESISEEQPMEIVRIEGELKETPKASLYVELGDLDYPQLLREDAPGKGLTAPPTGELLAKGATELELSLRAKAQQEVKQEVVKITGVTQNIKEEIIRVAGTKTDLEDQTEMRVGGDPFAQAKIADLERKVADLEEQLRLSAAASEPAEDAEEAEKEKKPRGGLLKKVWPFKKSEDEEIEEAAKAEAEAEAEQEAGSEAETEPETESEPEIHVAKKGEPGKSSGEPDATEAASNNLIVEIENGKLDRTLSKAQKEVGEIAKDSKAKKWVDGLMEELVAEKSRLHDMAKKLNQSIRQKELEFRTKETTLQEELRRRDEMLKQKNAALARTKEQLTTTSMNMERLKSSTQNAVDDAHYKQKYNLSQKILDQVKEENAQLKKKADELKLKVDQLSVKTRGPSMADFQAMMMKSEKLQRQLEEFKRANAQLTEKLNEQSSAKKKSAGGDPEELKKRLEGAVKMAAVAQKEVEQLSLRVEELEREETRLKKELDRSYNEMKALKAGKPGSGGGTPPKAA